MKAPIRRRSERTKGEDQSPESKLNCCKSDVQDYGLIVEISVILGTFVHKTKGL